jgi:hypothetical protein
MLRACNDTLNKSADLISNTGENKAVTLEQLQKYPISDDEILATWRERSNLWATLPTCREWRKLRCFDQKNRGLITIDGDL